MACSGCEGTTRRTAWRAVDVRGPRDSLHGVLLKFTVASTVHQGSTAGISESTVTSNFRLKLLADCNLHRSEVTSNNLFPEVLN